MVELKILPFSGLGKINRLPFNLFFVAGNNQALLFVLVTVTQIMKTKLLNLLITLATFASSCASSGVYINRAYLASHTIGGKLAVLPVDVFYSGEKPKEEDWYAEEQKASRQLQAEVVQTFFDYKNTHERHSRQYPVQLMGADSVNALLLMKMADLRTAWTMPADSVGRMIGADLVIKVQMDRERYMSAKEAAWANIGFAVLNGLLPPPAENAPPRLKYVKANDMDYNICLIATKTGDTVSSYSFTPGNRKDITRVNKKMAAKSVVFAGN
ncbi:hypothetical protein A0256_05300 [Mucilaginibacter sp. PAMC 26640]|nr:hypothetical protein A0256_05300 [Mucilaginibacter sp. PAMC 26640]